MVGCDFDIDGQFVVVLGFASGNIEARKHRTGELLHKTSMSSTIAQLIFYDYRQEGIPQVIAVDVQGEVKGMSITRQVRQFLVEPEVAVQQA